MGHGPPPDPDHHNHHHHHGPPPHHQHHHHGPPPHHHHHHHGPPPHHHHHHHHHSGSSESWESGEDNRSGEVGPDAEDEVQADKLQMVMYGAMGFLMCSLGFLFIITILSMLMKRARAGASYRNLSTAPVEFVRNPMEDTIKKPADKESLIQ